MIKHCSNYTGISLLPNMYKILSNTLLPRLTPYAAEIIGDHQGRYQHNRSTIDHIFCIHQLLEKKWEYKETVHKLFIDLKKFIIQLGGRSCIIIMKMVRLIKMCPNATHSRIWVLNICLTSFLLGMVKTRRFLSPLFFIFAFEYAIRRAQINQDG